MDNFENKVGQVIGDSVSQHSPGASFDGVWGKYQGNKKHIGGIYMSKKVISLIAALVIIISFTAGAAYTQSIRDKTDYSFADDPEVIGKWQAVDFVTNIEDFSPEREPVWEGRLYLNEYAFIKGGRMLDSINDGSKYLTNSSNTWTKGVIINKREETASTYVIEEIDGEQYMFCEWKSGDYTVRGMKPCYYVLKKLDSEDYSTYNPPRTQDNVDYPFEYNPQMPGVWESVDFVKKIEDFDPDARGWQGQLYLIKLEMRENGTVAFNGNSATTLEWTGDLILDKIDETASKCVITEIGNDTYMFFEWKSGDYTIRGMDPYYYVLKKKG